MTAVSKVSAELQRKLLRRGPSPKPVEADAKLLELEAALRRRGQAILCGPPRNRKDLYCPSGRGLDASQRLFTDRERTSVGEQSVGPCVCASAVHALGESESTRNAGVLCAATASVTGPALRIKSQAGVSGALIRGAGLDVAGTVDVLDGASSASMSRTLR